MFQEKMVEKKPDTTGAVHPGDHEPEHKEAHQVQHEAPKEPAVGDTTTNAHRDNNDQQAPIPHNAPAETNKDREDMPLEVAEALEAAEAKEQVAAEEKEQQKVEAEQKEKARKAEEAPLKQQHLLDDEPEDFAALEEEMMDDA